MMYPLEKNERIFDGLQVKSPDELFLIRKDSRVISSKKDIDTSLNQGMREDIFVNNTGSCFSVFGHGHEG
ncbi:16089_t:CDS:2, partial [Rhizophagus irregularis]